MYRFWSLLIVAISLVSTPVWAQSTRIQADASAEVRLNEEVYALEKLSDYQNQVMLISATAGDPALNGLLLSLAVKSGSTWNTFFLKDTGSYAVLPSAKRGYLKLKLHTDFLNEDGGVSSKPSLLFINLTQAHQPNGFIEIEEIEQ